MTRLRYLTWTFCAIAAASPLPAQEMAPASAPAATEPAVSTVMPMPILAPVVPRDLAIEAYYAAHNQAPVWFRDGATREAAAKLPALLRRSTLDGLTDGPELAARAEAALVSGQPADDKLLSEAWVRYVRALEAPIPGMAYGDPELELKRRSAGEILKAAAEAPSLSSHLDQVSAVNPLYSALRDQAIKDGADSDPRVRATLERLRLIPATGRAILVDIASAELWMI